jgi:parallel beta-helix repeat protein
MDRRSEREKRYYNKLLRIGVMTILVILTIGIFTAVTSADNSACACGNICVNETGWWRDGGAFNASDTPIQDAVNNATEGKTICVKDGIYNENVDMNVDYLTIQSENGSTSTIVQAASYGDHVFEVTRDYVNISGFTIKGATVFYMAGIRLGSRVDHCNISGNNASGNFFGIYLLSSCNNTVTNNNVSNNNYGILMEYSSSNNIFTNNIAKSSHSNGIHVRYHSSNNIFTDNIVANSKYHAGIHLYDQSNNNIFSNNIVNLNQGNGIYLGSSNNNTLINNTANSNLNYYGIYLEGSSNNMLTNNIANSNGHYGIRLYHNSNNNMLINNTASLNNNIGICLHYYSNSNTLTGNTANSNNNYGIYLASSSNNIISCNWVHNNTQQGFYLAGGSTGNDISYNNIIANGDYNTTSGGWEWNFHNEQADAVVAEHNYWGTDNSAVIAASIKEDPGTVDYDPFETGPVPCAPIPELPTIILFSTGLLALAGYVVLRRKER